MTDQERVTVLNFWHDYFSGSDYWH